MADDKRGRDEKADNEERRQRERELKEARTRADEEEPARGDADADADERLGDLDEALETHDYPTTTTELVAAYGDDDVETRGGTASLEEVLADTENRTYDSAADVRSRILDRIE